MFRQDERCPGGILPAKGAFVCFYGIGCDLCSLSHLEKKPFLCPRSGLCAPGVRPGRAGGTGAFDASPAPLNAHRLASAAADFAAKEAFLKAAGTGLREPFSLCEIEAVRQENGAPAYRFSGQTAAWVAQHRLRARLSLSHEGGMALAFCTLEEEN